MKPKTYTTPTRKNGDVSTRYHRAKTAKKCACCHKKIDVDTLYVKRVGVHKKRFYSSSFHPECYSFYRLSLMALINPFHGVKAS